MPFLKQLQANNNRDLFNENKQRYEDNVRMPALALIEAIGPHITEKLSPHFVAIPKKVGGSLMRVYRDIRFSKNKTPYKTNIGVQFRHELGKDVHAPGFYLHIEPDNCFLGSGIWRPESLFLNKIREFIVDNPRSWTKLMSDQTFSSQWTLIGGTLIRPPKGFGKEHPLMTDLKRKDFIAHKSFSNQLINSESFVDFMIASYQECDAYMAYLCMALEVDF